MGRPDSDRYVGWRARYVNKDISAAATKPPSKRFKWRYAVMLVVVCAAVGLGLAYRKSGSHPGEAPVRDVPRLDGKWIRYSPEFATRSKIAFAECQTGALSPVTVVTGTVTFDPQLVAAIGARIPGRVKRIEKFQGDLVKAGDVLLELESAELGEAQAALLSARAHADAAGVNEKRETQLAAQHVSSLRDAELARATAAAAKADVVAATQRVRAIGGTQSGEIGILTLTSPIDGKVVELNVSRGQSVEPTHTAMRVANLKRLWVDLSVFERELGHLHNGDAVELSPQTNASMVVTGKIAHIGDIIDLDTRSAQVRVVVENTDESLRPGQSVTAKIHTAHTTSPAPMIPLEAITSVDGKPTVFVAHDETAVEPRIVTLGPRDATHALVVSGLQLGERVAVNGVFALKAEMFR